MVALPFLIFFRETSLGGVVDVVGVVGVVSVVGGVNGVVRVFNIVDVVGVVIVVGVVGVEIGKKGSWFVTQAFSTVADMAEN